MALSSTWAPPGLLPRRWRLGKLEEFRLKMNHFHLHWRHEQAAAPDRVARVRRCRAAPELSEGRSRARRDADGDQPSDPIAGALLRSGSVPPAAAAPIVDPA